jgi:hypothetical protein
MKHEPFDGQLVLRRRNRWLLGFAVILGLSSLAAIAALFVAAMLTAPIGVGLFNLFIVSSLAFTWVAQRNVRAVPRATRVHADAEGLRLGSHLVPRSRIVAALVVPRVDGAALVRVTRRRELPIELVARDTDDARRVVHALGLGVSQHVAPFRALSPAMDRSWAFLAAILGPAVLVPVATNLLRGSGFVPLVFVFFALCMMVVNRGSRVTIGADGIVIAWLGTRRFISTAMIRSLSVYYESFWGIVGVEITRRSGASVRLPIGKGAVGQENVAVLIERIREAMEAAAASDIDAAASALARSNRSMREWMTSLRAIGAGANATLREAHVHAEQLWRVVESARASGADRAAAAIALSASDDDDHIERLRIAAEAIAEPKVRVAISAAASGDDEAMESALCKISDAEA